MQVPEPQHKQQQLKQTQIEQRQQLEEQVIIKEESPVREELPDFNTVYFVNETTGFIVGDNGTILKKVGGG
ncbi:MAG: photosystem II stability/assembly factor-like uncharacterized protein [Cellvibrionaceae bacterium]|jgi:photosystem II stability/assembly factor-like uncharacterized protein